MAVVTDNFNRADGALGANWVSPITNTAAASGTLKIASNQVGAVTDDKHTFGAYVGSFGDDQYSQVKVATIGAWIGACVRMSFGLDRFYYGFVFTANDYRLYRFWDGVHTSLATGTAVTWSAGDILKVEITGSAHPFTLKMYRNGVQVLSWTSASSADVKNGGNPGVGVYSPAGANLRLDDFEANSTSAVYVPTTPTSTDDFNRANGVIGSNWTNTPAAGGTFTIVSNKAVGPSASTQYYAFYNAATFTDNQFSQVTLSTLGQFSGVILRADAVLNRFYLGFYDSTVQLAKIYVMWDGTLTELANNGSASAWTAGDILRMEITGSVHPITITLYRNGVWWVGWTSPDSSKVRTGGKPGIQIYSLTGGMTLDDWGGGDPTQVVIPPSTGLTASSAGIVGQYQKHFA